MISEAFCLRLHNVAFDALTRCVDSVLSQHLEDAMQLCALHHMQDVRWECSLRILRHTRHQTRVSGALLAAGALQRHLTQSLMA